MSHSVVCEAVYCDGQQRGFRQTQIQIQPSSLATLISSQTAEPHKLLSLSLSISSRGSRDLEHEECLENTNYHLIGEYNLKRLGHFFLWDYPVVCVCTCCMLVEVRS